MRLSEGDASTHAVSHADRAALHQHTQAILLLPRSHLLILIMR